MRILNYEPHEFIPLFNTFGKGWVYHLADTTDGACETNPSI